MVLTDEQNGSLEKSLSDLNLSSEEVDRFEKAFKDPEFRKLFDDYAKEVADPKNKEETDLYLRQLESQQRVEEVYGEGVQLIVPEAGMVVKTEDRASGQKVFINICTSEKINQPEGKRSEDASGKRGMSWKIPLSLGPEKKGHDNKQQPCLVWDFVVHPDTLRMAQSNQAFLDMVVDTAVEKIGSVARGVKLAGSYKRPKMSYKAVPGHPKPSVQALRTGEGGRVDELGRLHPEIKGTNEPCAAAAAAADVASSERSGGSAAQRSAFKFPERSAAAQKLRRKPQGAQDAGFVHPGGEVTPEYRLIHRGRMDLAAAWGDAQRNLSLPELERPAELVLRVTLPQLRSAAEVDLHVAPAAVTLHVPARFKLDVSLPYQVEDAKGRARFDKTSSVLEVCLPVKPPPAPPPSEPAPPPAAAPAADECSCSADAGGDDDSVDRAPAEEAAQGGAAAAAGDGPPTESSVSETRARWQEMNEQRDRLDSEQQRPAAAAAAAEAEAACRTGSPAGFTASAEFLGARPGCAFKLGPHGLGYYPDRPPPAPQQPAPNSGSRERALAALASAGVGGVPAPEARPRAHSASEAPRLAPRVGAALVYELD